MPELSWECACGQIEYGEEPPTECEKCFRISSFTQLPEELIEEREKELVEEPVIAFKKEKSVKKVTKPAKKPGRKKK